MGWLFAVALGLHRRSRLIVWLAPIPMALGHALSVAVVAAAFVWAGLVVDARLVRIGAGLALIAWAIYHWRYGHRHRVRFGMQVGLAGLVVWSFLMATAHGAGLMLWPALMPLCRSGSAAATGAPLATAAVGISLHTAVMLAVTAAIAVTVYEWVGLGFLRRGSPVLDVRADCNRRASTAGECAMNAGTVLVQLSDWQRMHRAAQQPPTARVGSGSRLRVADQPPPRRKHTRKMLWGTRRGNASVGRLLTGRWHPSALMLTDRWSHRCATPSSASR